MTLEQQLRARAEEYTVAPELVSSVVRARSQATADLLVQAADALKRLHVAFNDLLAAEVRVHGGTVVWGGRCADERNKLREVLVEILTKEDG